MSEASLPYPGLRPFLSGESHLFFGREQHTDELLTRLERSRFLAVVGASGCGKSSLVRAGVIAGLETGFIASTGSRWRVATLRPGGHPMQRLADALAEEPALGPQLVGEQYAAEQLYATLTRGSLGLVEVLQETSLEDRTNLLVLVDQFEELFRYQQIGNDEAEAFVALLLESARQKDFPIHVIITMRSDSLGDCARFMGLPEAMNDSQYLTPRLTREQRQAAIEGPARVFGGDVEPELVNRILNEMGSDPDQLPLMQHVLMRMWSQANRDGSPRILTLKAYETAGGLQMALSNHADEAFAELDTAQQEVAQVMFRALAERGRQQRDTRRPATISEIAGVAGVSEDDVLKVAAVFRRPDRSFIMPPLGESLQDRPLDISHESLIKYWKKFAGWVEAEAYSVWLFRRLREQASLWAKGQGALWKTPDLENGVVWRETKPKPGPVWAERYGGRFDLAKRFLEASEREKHAEEAAKRREERTRRELRLTRIAALLFVAFMMAAIGVAVISHRYNQREKRLLADMNFDRMTQLVSNNRAADALPLLARALRADRQDFRVKTFLIDALTRKSWPLPVAIVSTGQNVRKIVFSADGQRVLTVYQDSSAQLWNAAVRTAWQPIGERLRHRGTIRSASFSPDGTRVVTGSADQTAELWDAATGRPIAQLPHGGAVNSVAFSFDGRQVVTGSQDGLVRIWDANTGHRLGRALRDGASVTLAVFDRGAQTIMTADTAGDALLWDARTAESLKPLQRNPGVLAVTFSPDGQEVVGVFDDSPVSRWNLVDGEAQRRARYEGRVREAAFSPDGRWVVTVLRDSTVRVWNANGQSIGEPLHLANVTAAAVSSDGRWLATAATDSTVRLWDVAPGQATSEPLVHAQQIYATAFNAKGARIVAASADGSVRIWDAATGEPVGDPLRQSGAIRSAAFSLDGRRVLTVSTDGVRLFDAASGRSIGEPLVQRGQIYDAAFSRDGQLVITGSDDYTAQIWDATTSKRLGPMLPHKSEVLSVRFSVDGRWMVTGSAEGARVWDARTRLAVGPPLRPSGVVRTALVSPDGQTILTVSDSATQLWERASGLPIGEPLKHQTGRVISAAFSPDGRLLVTGANDGMARIWDVATGRKISQLEHPPSVSSVAFSPDGRRIVTASVDGTVRVWEVPVNDSDDAASLALLAEAVAGSSLNRDGAIEPVRDPIGQLAKLRNAAAPGSFVRWFLSDRCTRPISPLSQVTMLDYLRRAGTNADPVLVTSCPMVSAGAQ